MQMSFGNILDESTTSKNEGKEVNYSSGRTSSIHAVNRKANACTCALPV